jgi:hypothetical protein
LWSSIAYTTRYVIVMQAFVETVVETNDDDNDDGECGSLCDGIGRPDLRGQSISYSKRLVCIKYSIPSTEATDTTG